MSPKIITRAAGIGLTGGRFRFGRRSGAVQFQAFDAVEGFFVDQAAGGNQIGNHAQHKNEQAQCHQRAANHHRLQKPAIRVDCAAEVEVEKSPQQQHTAHQKRQAEVRKRFERLIEGVQAQDSGRIAFDVVPVAGDEARLAQGRVDVDGHTADGQSFFARLDDGFQGVGVFGENGQTHGGVAGQGTEPAGGVGDGRAGGHPHHPTAPVL